MRHDPDAVMLFAAGFGTRMGDLTRHRPKPLIPVGGKALLDHTLDLADAAGISRVVVNAHYHADQIEAHLQGSGAVLSHETPEVLETGGGLRHALPLLGDAPVFTANTDAVWQGTNPFEMLRNAWRPDDMDALLLCIPLENAVGHSGKGDFLLDEAGRISRGPGVIYGGVQIVKTDGLRDIKEEAFSLNLLWNQMQAKGRLFGLCYDGRWCDVGSPAGITLAEEMLEARDV